MANPKTPTQQGTAAIFDQIEADADYYPPGFYASLLGFYSNLQLEVDALGGQYIALSSVAQRGRNPKKFVIGVLPPVGTVSGRILDRSTSIATEVPIPSSTVSVVNGTPQVTVPKVQNLGNIFTGKPGSTLDPHNTHLSEDQARLALATGYERVTGQAPSDEVLNLLVAQSAVETADWTKISNYAFAGVKASKGSNFVQNLRTVEYIPPPPAPNGVRTVVDPPDPATRFEAYQSPEDGATAYVATLAHRSNWWEGLHTGTPEGLIAGLSTPPAYFTSPPDLYLKNLKQKLGTFDPSVVANTTDETSPDWQKTGSSSAGTSRQEQAQLANTDLNNTQLGQQFQAAQRAQIRATQEALTKLQNVPPLQMLVNPKSFTVRGEKITQDGNWGRNGPIIEHWGDNQDKISGSGSVAAFYALSAGNVGSNGPGLTRMARNFSMSYQNFMSLYLLYRNNAGLYIQDYASQEKRLNLSTLGTIYLYYDNILYLGSFDSFNVSEDDTRPFTLDYSFEFTVRASFLLDHPSEQGFTYGFPAALPTRTQTIPSGNGGDVGGQFSGIPGLSNEEVAAFVANDPNDPASSPQTPGNEAGAQATKDQIQDEINRLTTKFQNGELTTDFYFKQLDQLQGQLNSVL